jgi:hypothetical protein
MMTGLFRVVRILFFLIVAVAFWQSPVFVKMVSDSAAASNPFVIKLIITWFVLDVLVIIFDGK